MAKRIVILDDDELDVVLGWYQALEYLTGPSPSYGKVDIDEDDAEVYAKLKGYAL